MAFTFDDLIEGLRESRSNFHKHLGGLRDDQWDWKPYPECKSIRETLIHLVVDDRAGMSALETSAEPDYEALVNAAVADAGTDLAQLQALVADSFTQLLTMLQTKYSSLPLDTEVSVFGHPKKLGAAVPFFSSEDYYHAGQVAFIRMASDPTWNYYAQIYGM